MYEPGQVAIELSLLATNLSNMDNYLNITNSFKYYTLAPRESYLIVKTGDGLSVAKCLTFFSYLDPQWRNFKMNIDSIHVKIHYKYQWSPPHLINSLCSVHSPNTLPMKLGKSLFPIAKNHLVYLRYARLETHLLESPYKTDCVNYDSNKGIGNGKYEMRSDCITDCKQRACGQIVVHGVRIRKEYLEQNRHLKFGSCSINESERLHVHCNKMCKVECHSTNFIYDKTERSDKDGHLALERSQNMIIEHNRLPDVVVEHHPEINLISLICNFGGLLGMWCGLSVFMFLDKVIWITINTLKSPRTNINNNNNLFVIYNKCANKMHTLNDL